jgi:hypothetical protein
MGTRQMNAANMVHSTQQYERGLHLGSPREVIGAGMRGQYHFRRSERGLLAWDVHRLVALSRDFPREWVPLNNIRELDESFWSNEGPRMTCRQVVEHARLMNECDLAFPVILSSDGRVMDGMHRVCNALLVGLDKIQAVRFIDDPEPDHIGVHTDNLPYVDAE